MHRSTPRFWERFEHLPENIQRLARGNFELLKLDPRHPSLHFRRVGRFWSVRVGLDYRALAREEDGTFWWVWIGSHAEYDRIIGAGR